MNYSIKVIWKNGEKDTFQYQDLDSAVAMKNYLRNTGGYSSMKPSW